jgi:hypothetical protein
MCTLSGKNRVLSDSDLVQQTRVSRSQEFSKGIHALVISNKIEPEYASA